MSKKIRKYFPNYQINSSGAGGPQETGFRFGDVYFVTKWPLFGATETQKAAIEWASWSKPPVMWVSHEKPTSPDRDRFCDPRDQCRHYKPYAMAIATLQCLGETTERKVKIYFCNLHVSVHSSGGGWLHDTSSKDFFAVELDGDGKEIPSHRWGSDIPYSLPPVKNE
jgi:hypothetical protein